MISYYKDLYSFRGVMGSDHRHLDDLIHKVEGYLTELKIEDMNRILIILRELVINAIKHGNHGEVKKKVFFTVERISSTEFHISVGDEGEGFDYRKVNMEIEEKPLKMEKRGYALISALSDRLEFDNNGTSVTSVLTLNLSA